MVNLEPSIQKMPEGMTNFKLTHQYRKTPQESKEIESKIETQPAAETMSTIHGKPSISEVIMVVKAYHSEVISGFRSSFDETIDALEQHHTQLIGKLELMHQASLAAPKGQTLSEKEHKITEMKVRAEASSAARSLAEAIKSLKNK